MRNFKITSLVDAFMSKKERTEYYQVNVFDDDFLREEIYLNPYDNQTISALRELNEKYGSDEFFKHLDEVFDDEDDISDVSCGREILSFDVDTPHYKYLFVIHELREDGTLDLHNVHVEMTDEEYKKLLCYCIQNPKLTFNTLRRLDKKLYDSLADRVDWYYSDDIVGDYRCYVSYLVTMDEVRKDADEIIRNHPELKDDDYPMF